jgi:hypothetical protein
MRGLVESKIADTDARIAELAALAAELRRAAAQLESRPLDGPCDATCGCTSSTDVATPIACSLGADDLPARVAQWRAVLRSVVDRSPIRGGLRLTFTTRGPMAELVRLIDAEHDCCAFFSFAVTVDDRGVGLEVTAPDDGLAVLHDLFGESP